MRDEYTWYVVYRQQISTFYSMDQVWPRGEIDRDWQRPGKRRHATFTGIFPRERFESRWECENAARELKHEFEKDIDIAQLGLAHAEIIYEQEFVMVEMFMTEEGENFVNAHTKGYFWDFSTQTVDMEATRKLMEYLLSSSTNMDLLHRVFSRQTDPAFIDLTRQYVLNKLAGQYDKC